MLITMTPTIVILVFFNDLTDTLQIRRIYQTEVLHSTALVEPAGNSYLEHNLQRYNEFPEVSAPIGSMK